MVQAQERLHLNRTPGGTTLIEQLKSMHDLGDEVELAMRMLRFPRLTELSSQLGKSRAVLAGLPDKNERVMSLISKMDPDVEVLVAGLMRLDEGVADGEVGEAVAEPEQSPSEVVIRAQARLDENKGKVDVSAIQRLTVDCGLLDEVELALRMLSPDHLREVLAGWAEIKRKCAEKQDGGKFMLTVISQLDPEIDELMRALLDLDSVPEDQDFHVVQKARARLDVPQGKADLAAIRRLKSTCNFGDEVELALQMLSTENLQEIFAGEADIKQKIAAVEDPGSFMMWLISQLDDEIPVLVQKLVEIEAKESEQEQPNQQNNAQVHDFVEQSTPEAVAEARSRLQEHNIPANLSAIQNFQVTLGLGDEVELALRMLNSDKLWKVLTRKVQLRTELATVSDKNQYVLRYVSEQDPKVEVLVRKLMQVDSQDQADDSRSRSPIRAPIVRQPAGAVDDRVAAISRGASMKGAIVKGAALKGRGRGALALYRTSEG